MAKQQQQMQMPGVFGGLMRYDTEYKSRFMLSPAVIIAFAIAIIVFVLVLTIFFPISSLSSIGVAFVGVNGGVFWPLLGSLV